MSLLLDDDLCVVLKDLSTGRMTEAWTHRMIMKLMLELQEARKVLKVAHALDPGINHESIKYEHLPSTIAPHKFYKSVDKENSGGSDASS